MIKIFAMDVDGTLTDGKINISDQGEVFKSFNVKDGMGIKLLLKNNIIPIIITGRISKIVEKRAQELGIKHVYQQVVNKELIIDEIAKKFNVTTQEIAYIGDDINDLEIMKLVGHTYAPADSVKVISDYVDYVCNHNGGNGAVREACEHILTINNT